MRKIPASNLAVDDIVVLEVLVSRRKVLPSNMTAVSGEWENVYNLKSLAQVIESNAPVSSFVHVDFAGSL